MFRKSIATLLSAALLLAGVPADAKKDGANVGGRSTPHMSKKGQMNTNAPAMGQEKGMMRADERKSEQGLAHDQAGGLKDEAKPENKGKAKGRAK